jgi:K+-sensing histidine kinase KdpD
MQLLQRIKTKMPVTDPTLHGIVTNLIHGIAPLALHNKNYVVNNVPPDLQVAANGSIISSVLDNLFHTAIRHTQNSVILISARVYGQAVLLQVKSRGTVSPSLSAELGQVCMKAKKTGGVIELTRHETEQASIAYCFLNIAGQA